MGEGRDRNGGGFARRVLIIVEDCCGIPPDMRDEVFDIGYSTEEDSIGFGLNTVQRIAEAHRREICVTDSTDGGARFDCPGVEFAAA